MFSTCRRQRLMQDPSCESLRSCFRLNNAVGDRRLMQLREEACMHAPEARAAAGEDSEADRESLRADTAIWDEYFMTYFSLDLWMYKAMQRKFAETRAAPAPAAAAAAADIDGGGNRKPNSAAAVAAAVASSSSRQKKPKGSSAVHCGGGRCLPTTHFTVFPYRFIERTTRWLSPVPLPNGWLCEPSSTPQWLVV
jgi:hypothetical protein